MGFTCALCSHPKLWCVILLLYGVSSCLYRNLQSLWSAFIFLLSLPSYFLYETILHHSQAPLEIFFCENRAQPGKSFNVHKAFNVRTVGHLISTLCRLLLGLAFPKHFLGKRAVCEAKCNNCILLWGYGPTLCFPLAIKKAKNKI